MKYTYRLSSAAEGFVARCLEIPVSALGATEDAAVAALRQAVFERFAHVEAVAPPTSTPRPSIELEEAQDPTPEPQGPGDSPAAERVPHNPP